MAKRTQAKISKSSQGFTEITYVPDLARFEMTEINDSHWKMMRKRVIDIAAANPGLKLEFCGEKYRFKTFKEYVDLYVTDSIWEKSKDWEFAMGVSKDGYQSVSFVNSIQTKDGGTHETYIINQVIEYLRTMIKKKHKVDVKPSEIKNHMFLFINCTVINPAFSSQTKEKLITEAKDFGTKHDVTEKFAKAVFSSEVIQSLLDWIEQKKNAEERAELRKLNKSLSNTKVLKLIDAKGKDRNKCVLGIFEGMSALSAVRKFRDPQNFGAFPLKGKFLNVSEMTNSGVIQNDEVVQLMASLGIKLGEEPKDLRYGKVYIYTDADPDGDSIAALLINFFNKYWPELFDQGRVFKVMTPLVVAKKGKDVKPFYSNEEYSEWEKKTGAKGWDVEYKKGLAALENVEYRDIIHSPVLVKLQNDKLYKDSLSDWFGSDSEPRKEKLLKLSI
jgi:DNA topoisomerase-2